MTVGVAFFYIPRRLRKPLFSLRKPHFSEFKGSGISVFEFFRGLNFLNVVVLKKFPGLRVRGFEGRRVLGFQGCRFQGLMVQEL